MNIVMALLLGLFAIGLVSTGCYLRWNKHARAMKALTKQMVLPGMKAHAERINHSQIDIQFFVYIFGGICIIVLAIYAYFTV